MYQGNTAFSKNETRWMCKLYYSHEMFWTEAYNVLMHVYPEQYFKQYKEFFFQMLLNYLFWLLYFVKHYLFHDAFQYHTIFL